MGTLEITRGRQALELRSNLSERRALTDPIRSPGRDEASARNLQWAKAHGERRGRSGAGTGAGDSTGHSLVAGAPCRRPWSPHPRVQLQPWGPAGPSPLSLSSPPVLPESRHLHFDCGVTVQLGFAAEFSNIMIIYTRVVATPGDIAKCEAKLTDIPEVGPSH